MGRRLLASSFVLSFVHSLIDSFIRSLIRSFSHELIYRSFVHSFVHSFSNLGVYLLIHSFGAEALFPSHDTTLPRMIVVTVQYNSDIRSFVHSYIHSFGAEALSVPIARYKVAKEEVTTVVTVQYSSDTVAGTWHHYLSLYEYMERERQAEPGQRGKVDTYHHTGTVLCLAPSPREGPVRDTEVKGRR